MQGEMEEYSDTEFGKRRKSRKSRRGRKSRGYIMVKGRKRKLYRGKNGSYYYRTRSGKSYVKGRMSFGGDDEYHGEMEFGERKPGKTRILKALQLIADDFDPNFKFSSRLSKNGRPKLLTADALKRKFTKNNIDWKRNLEVLLENNPRTGAMPGVASVKFKGGIKYLRMIATRWFGPEFKFKIRTNTRQKPTLLSQEALKRKLSKALNEIGVDWRIEANDVREKALEIHKNLKTNFLNNGQRRTNATKMANKIMKDNEEGIGNSPEEWVELYNREINRGSSPESAAWAATGVTIDYPPRSGLPVREGIPIAQGIPVREGISISRGSPAGIGYKAFMDEQRPFRELPRAMTKPLISERPGQARSLGAWLEEQDDSYRAAAAALPTGTVPTLDAQARELEAWERRRAAADQYQADYQADRRAARAALPAPKEEKNTGMFAGMTMAPPTGLLDFGRKRRRAQYRRKRC